MRVAVISWSFLLGAGLLGAAQAQLQVATIHVRVLHGHNARPLRQAATLTTVLPIEPYATPIPRTTDAAGRVPLLVQHDVEVRVQVMHFEPCGRVSRAARKQPPQAYPVQQILATGVVGQNGCSKRAVAPTPGELTLLVRPRHWWERHSF